MLREVDDISRYSLILDYGKDSITMENRILDEIGCEQRTKLPFFQHESSSKPCIIQRNLLPLHPPDDNMRRILRDDLVIVQHLKLL